MIKVHQVIWVVVWLKIGENKREVIIKDSNLYGKVERLLPLIKSSSSNEPPKQSSGIYDFTSANNEGKIYTNTPGMGY